MLARESLFQQYGQTYLGVVPTAAEHAGNFAGITNTAGAAIALKKPYSSYAVFPGNIIPTSMIDPVGAKIVSSILCPTGLR